MKIKGNDFTFILPISKIPTILVSDYSKEVNECLYSYFVQKKKNKCIVYDENDIMKYDDINYIYISKDISLDANMSFKPKSIMNLEISSIVESNPEFFYSLERIRSELNCLLTDKGMYKLKKILGNGMNKNIEILIDSFDIQDVISMLCIDCDNMGSDGKIVIILNLLLYVNRDKTNLIFIDYEVTKLIEDIILNSSQNNFFVINNERISKITNTYNLLILDNTDSFEEVMENQENIKLMSFINHKLISDNIDLINNKNILKLNNFKDKNKTFLIKSYC